MPSSSSDAGPRDNGRTLEFTKLMGRRAAALLATTVLAAAGAVSATWPLAQQIGSATLGSGEVLLTAWQLNAYHQALVTNPLAWADANIFFPYDRAAAFNDLLLSHALVTLPAVWADSPVLALNLAFLGGIVLCAVFAHLLILEVTGEPWAAAVGGTLFALAPFRFLHVGHLSIAAAWAVPLFFFLLLRHMREPSPSRAVLTAASGLLVVSSSLYHAAFVAPLVPLVLLVAARRGRIDGRTWLPLVLSAIPALLIAASLLAPFAAVVNDHGLGSAEDDLRRYGADLTSLGRKPPFLDAAAGTSTIGPEAHLYPGTALACLGFAAVLAAAFSLRGLEGWRRILALALAGCAGAVCAGLIVTPADGIAPLWRLAVLTLLWIMPVALAVWAIRATTASRPVGPDVAIRLGLAGASLAFVFALGPEARHLGRDIGTAPYWLLTELSAGFSGTRVPARFGGLVILFLAIAAAGVIARLRNASRPAVRASAHAIALAALAGCLFELPRPGSHGLVALPALRDPVYRWLADRPGRFGVIELPDWPAEANVHWRHREWRSLRHMLASKQHGQHLVNGSGRVEPFLWERLRWHEPFSDSFFAYVASYLPVEYALVHDGGLPQESRDAIWARLESGRDGWEPLFRSPAIRVNTVDRSAGRGPMIERLFLRRELAPAADVRFEARLLTADGATGASTAQLTLHRDGEALTSYTIHPEWQNFRLVVPVSATPGKPTGEWPRTTALFRWQVRKEGAVVEMRELSVEPARGPSD
jgi:hypothetical protein